MEKQTCTHYGFIVEYPEYYQCTKCKDIAYKVILKNIDGIWLNETEPQEVLKQRLFENILRKQQNKKYQKCKIHIDNAFAVFYTLKNSL